MSIEKNIKNVKNNAANTQLIIVTKKQNIESIRKVYNIGERHFGENRVNDLINKKKYLPNDIKWHMIGHLQTNKVKLITPFIYLIQSVDSIKLLNKINECGKQNHRIINCLIQIKVSQEETKYGFSEKESISLLTSDYKNKYQYVNIKGIMGMASFTNNTTKIQAEFRTLKNIYSLLKSEKYILSMGMSNDYKVAYKLGSNMIRIGSLIFN
tara:strand:- start:353 stop:985 length:633 start_codon:yes stop_codon:yes gene_type:complete